MGGDDDHEVEQCQSKREMTERTPTRIAYCPGTAVNLALSETALVCFCTPVPIEQFSGGTVFSYDG